MKCKDCGSTLCIYRTCGDEQDCFYESHPDYTLPKDFGCDFRNNIDWHSLRNQAAIAAMQGTITILSDSDKTAFNELVVVGFNGSKKTYPNEIAEFAVACADALIEELKKK